MPRVNGVYAEPPGTKGAPNTVIKSGQYNTFIDDLVQDANTARPILAGGTGATTAVGAADALATVSTDIAAAATTNLAAATGVFVTITGSASITSLGTVSAGAERVLLFNGVCTLVHNDPALILPGLINFVTAAGDVLVFRSSGGGNWRCVSVQPRFAAPLSGHRNKIINGDFDVWQRWLTNSAGGSASSGSNFAFSFFSADRWIGFVQTPNPGTGVNNIILSRTAHTLGTTAAPGNPRFFMRFQHSAVQSGAANSVAYLAQRIERVDTLSGKTVTLTFYARAASAATCAVQLTQNFGTTGSPSSPVVIAPSGSPTFTLTTSWQKFTFTFNVPSVSGKTLGTAGNDYLELDFIWVQQSGSVLGNAYGAVGTYAPQTYDLSHVSLVEGVAVGEADPFSPRQFGEEYDLCQRYYFSTYRDGVQQGTITSLGVYRWNTITAAGGVSTAKFRVLMRAIPSFGVFNPVVSGASARDETANLDRSVTINGASEAGCTFAVATGAAGNVMLVHLIADAEL